MTTYTVSQERQTEIIDHAIENLRDNHQEITPRAIADNIWNNLMYIEHLAELAIDDPSDHFDMFAAELHAALAEMLEAHPHLVD